MSLFDIAVTELTIGADNGTSTTYVTASITPSFNHLVVVDVGNTSAAPDSVSGCGLSWSQVGTAVNSDGTARCTRWSALGISPVQAGAITIGFTNAQANCRWSVGGVAEADVTGSIVQTATAASTSSTASTVALAAFADATNNAVLVGSYWAASTAGFAIDVVEYESGYTEFSEALGGGPPAVQSGVVRMAWVRGQDTSVIAACSSANPNAAIASEIAVRPYTNVMDDMAVRLQAQGVAGLPGSTQVTDTGGGITKSFMPPDPAKVITLTETGGFPAEGRPELNYPTFQVKVRASSTDYSTGREKLAEVEAALHNLASTSYNDWYYAGVFTQGDALSLGFDMEDRPIIAQNYRALRSRN